MTERTIEAIIDVYLQKSAGLGINMLPRKIDPAMAGPSTVDGWTFWYPIPSKVTEDEVRGTINLVWVKKHPGTAAEKRLILSTTNS